MTTENMYGEPWEPPPLMVVNVAASRLVEESGISAFIDIDDMQERLNWIAQRAYEAPSELSEPPRPGLVPDPDRVAIRLALHHLRDGTPAVFRIELELQDLEREGSCYITDVRRIS